MEKMRLIDAEALRKWYAETSDDGKYGFDVFTSEVLADIDNAPTIDAVPVIRCKYCKHRHLDGMIWDCPFGLTGGEDFFCAYGEKVELASLYGKCVTDGEEI